MRPQVPIEVIDMNNSIQNTPAFVNVEIAIYRGMVNEAISFIDALSDKNEITSVPLRLIDTE